VNNFLLQTREAKKYTKNPKDIIRLFMTGEHNFIHYFGESPSAEHQNPYLIHDGFLPLRNIPTMPLRCIGPTTFDYPTP
jgi:hypothetical protein